MEGVIWNMKANVFLIGSQKSGTTTLASLLGKHPEINVSEPKEPHFFTHNYSNGLEWYGDTFIKSESKIYLDASTTYSMASISRKEGVLDNVPEKIYEYNPNSKFIYILRDPIYRTYSSYLHSLRRRGKIYKNFKEALDSNSFFLDTSNYVAQIKKYYEYFPKDSFLFLTFEDFRDDYQEVLNKCFSFLEVTGMEIEMESIKNKAYQLNRMGNILYLFNRKSKILDSLFDKLKTKFSINLKRSLRERFFVSKDNIAPMSEEDMIYLKKYFEGMKDELIFLTNVNYNKWEI